MALTDIFHCESCLRARLRFWNERLECLTKAVAENLKHKAKSGKNTRSKPSTFRAKGARGRPTNIANAIVIKDADVFVLCQNDAEPSLR